MQLEREPHSVALKEILLGLPSHFFLAFFKAIFVFGVNIKKNSEAYNGRVRNEKNRSPKKLE